MNHPRPQHRITAEQSAARILSNVGKASAAGCFALASSVVCSVLTNPHDHPLLAFCTAATLTLTGAGCLQIADKSLQNAGLSRNKNLIPSRDRFDKKVRAILSYARAAFDQRLPSP